jgi:hypothetical protein
MTLNRRTARLEDELDVEDGSPPLEQRLRQTWDRIQEHRRLATEPPEPPSLEGHFGERLKRALRRAAEARRLIRS